MDDPLTILTLVAVILLGGVLIAILARKIKLPDILLFVLFGLYIGSIQYRDGNLISFPINFVTGIAILALVMVVFDSTSKIKIKAFDTHAIDTVKVVFTFLILVLLLLTPAVMNLFGLSFGMALLFAAVMGGTAPSVVLPMMRDFKARSIRILQFESVLNTPLTVLLPFLIHDVLQSVTAISISAKFIEELGPFLAKFVTGIGAGVFVGLILFQTLKHAYSRIYSPLSVMLAALLAFVLAENLGGNGVLSVTTLGLFFGNTLTKGRLDVLEAGAVLARSLYILVFVMLGATIKIPWNYDFFIMSLALFTVYIVIRFVSIQWATRASKLPIKEKVFMSFMASKGIAVAVVAFALSTSTLPKMKLVLDLIVVFILYSIVLAALAGWMADYFLEK